MNNNIISDNIDINASMNQDYLYHSENFDNIEENVEDVTHLKIESLKIEKFSNNKINMIRNHNSYQRQPINIDYQITNIATKY